MRTLLLHIGTATTGTSSIQEALARAQESEAIRPVCYPLLRGERNHFRMGTLYLPYQRLPRGSQVGRARHEVQRRRYRRALFGQLRAASSAILSSEALPILNAAEAGELRRDLESAGFQRLVIALYLRDPANFYVSRVQQDLKASSRLRDPNSFRYPFREIAETWEKVFPGNVIVRRYVDNPDFDVVRDFSGLMREHLGVELPPFPARLNTSMSAEAMEIVQRYRARFWGESDDVFTPDTDRLLAGLERARDDVRQNAPALRPEISELIRANHRADAEIIRERYGVDLELADAREPAPQGIQRADRVRDILSNVDPEVVTELLLRASKSGLDRGSSNRFRRLAARGVELSAAPVRRWTGRPNTNRRRNGDGDAP